MSSAPNPWRVIAIVAIAFAFFSISPFTVSKQPDGVGGNNINAKLDDVIARLERIESVVGCPVDAFIAGTCTHNPASTSVTFCISQGRQGELAAAVDAELYAEVEGGVSWDLGPLGKLKGTMEYPLLLAGFLPLPTEAKIGATAGLGRGLDICIEVPLEVIAADQARLANLVKGMNAGPEPGKERSKFQRRLNRILNFAERRTPNPANPVAVTADARSVVGTDEEFDVLDDAIERFMAGEFQVVSHDEPFGFFKDPVIADLRSALELPDLLARVLDDPQQVLAAIPNPFVEQVTCETFGLGAQILQRFPHIADKCAKLANLPRFDVTSTAFQTVHDIREFVTELPDEVIFGVADILPDLKPEKLPTPRPPGRPICNVFPRLCR